MAVLDHIDEIAKRYLTGETLQEIGNDYGVTREYIRQLVAKKGITAKQGGARVRKKKRQARLQARREARFLKKYGMSREEYYKINGVEPRPIRCYTTQRTNARHRGIEFNMTFAEWWSVWKDKWHLRGRHACGLVMARHGDDGPYEIGNVKLITLAENASEQYLYR